MPYLSRFDIIDTSKLLGCKVVLESQPVQEGCMRNGNHSEECNVEDEYDIRERNYRSWNSMQSLKKQTR